MRESIRNLVSNFNTIIDQITNKSVPYDTKKTFYINEAFINFIRNNKYFNNNIVLDNAKLDKTFRYQLFRLYTKQIS
jgi:hypothetical protein